MRENGQDTADALQILFWIYSDMDTPPTPTFNQNTCTLLCLFCVGAKSSNTLLSVVFHRTILAMPRPWSLERHTQAFCSALPSCPSYSSSCLFVILLLATRNPHCQLWAMLCCFGKASLRAGGDLWEKQWLAAGEQKHTRWEVLTPAARREAGCGQTELARCLQDCGATFGQSRAPAKLLIVAQFSCLLPSQVTNGNESLCRVPCLPVALGGP